MTYEEWKDNLDKSIGNPKIPRLFIIRGLPGSGKSYFASQLYKDYSVRILDPDSYHMIGLSYEWSKEGFYRNKVLNIYPQINKYAGICDLAYCEVLPRIDDVLNIIYLVEKRPVIICVIDLKPSKFDNIHNVCEEDMNKFKTTWEDWSGRTHFLLTSSFQPW